MTREWIFHDASDHANAAAELYRVTRPTIGMREALQAMVTDGTGALAWGFDPAEKPLAIDELDRSEASKLLAAGYAVRRVLGVHPLDDVEQPSDEPAPSTRPSSKRASKRAGDVAGTPHNSGSAQQTFTRVATPAGSSLSIPSEMSQ